MTTTKKWRWWKANNSSETAPPSLSKPFQGVPSLFQEKKDCLFLAGGEGGEGRRINPARQINSKAGQIPTDTGQKMKSPVDLEH
jgi:hypothetical protein